MSGYPEHDKLSAVKAASQAQGELLEWLSEKGWTICSLDEFDRFTPVRVSIEKILAEFHEIDLDTIDSEKEAMLAEMRALQKRS